MKAINNFIEKCRLKTRAYTDPYLGPIRRRLFLGEKDSENASFTVICNNCWGGYVYRHYGLPYSSPTIGLYFFADDYIKFIYNLKYYMSVDLRFLSTYKKSKHKKEIEKNGGGSLNCPIGVLDDIEVVFLHFHSEDEAMTKWNKRKKRINWNNLVFKFSEMNFCTQEHLAMFDEFPADKKICFVTKDYRLKCQVIFKQYKGLDTIKNDTTNFNRYFNLDKFIKTGILKK